MTSHLGDDVISSDRTALERLAVIETLLKTELRSLNERATDQEGRMRVLEKWRYALPVSLFTAALSAVATVVVAFVK